MPDHKPGVTGASETLNAYWTRGRGLSKWVASPHPWTTLVVELSKYMPLNQAKGLATEYFHQVFGFYPGSDLNRVMHGHLPKGKVIGPG